MRACDHKVIQDLTIEEYVQPNQQKLSMSIPPYYWFKGQSAPGPQYNIPADKNPPMDGSKIGTLAKVKIIGENKKSGV